MIALYNYLRTCHHYLSDRFEQVNPIRLTLERLGILPPPPPSPLPQSASGERCLGSSEVFSFLFSLVLYRAFSEVGKQDVN